MAEPLIHLEVITPEGTFLDDYVFYVLLPGSLCPFTVLPGHAALISSLDKGLIAFEGNDGEGSILIKSGFVRVQNNKVTAAIEF
ncbi:MAG: hypothetical protein J6T02_05230 [Bacteroidales bacterium]|nr:hypothetical protein [Bacteroidales bacterium]